LADSLRAIMERIKESSRQEHMDSLGAENACAFMWRLASSGVPPDYLETVWSHLHVLSMFLKAHQEYEGFDSMRPWDFSRLICTYYPKNFWIPPNLPREVLVEVQKGLLITIADYARFLIDQGEMKGPCFAEEALQRMFQERGRVKRLRRPAGKNSDRGV